MKCSDVMKTNVVTCRPDETVAAVAMKMRDKNIGFVPVCDEKGRVIGTVTDRDLAIRVLADRSRSLDTRIDEVMTREVVACRPGDELRVAEQRMSEHKKSRMLVTEDDGRLVGVLSLSDIAEVERRGRSSAVLEKVAEREARH